jgi:hypothetical protein
MASLPQFQQSLHPRRPLAKHSVSLRHYNGPSPEPSLKIETHTEASSGSLSSNKPNVSKTGSGESSNADRWFDGANENAGGKNNNVIDSESLSSCPSLVSY